MSAPDENEEKTCTTFEPQAWRKTMCKNCFRTSEEHCESASDDTSKAATGSQEVKRDSSEGKTTDKDQSSPVRDRSSRSPISPSFLPPAKIEGIKLREAKRTVPLKRAQSFHENTNFRKEGEFAQTHIKSGTPTVFDFHKLLHTSATDTDNEDNEPKSEKRLHSSSETESDTKVDSTKPPQRSTGNKSFIKRLAKSFSTEAIDDVGRSPRERSSLDRDAIQSNADVIPKCQTKDTLPPLSTTDAIGTVSSAKQAGNQSPKNVADRNHNELSAKQAPFKVSKVPSPEPKRPGPSPEPKRQGLSPSPEPKRQTDFDRKLSEANQAITTLKYQLKDFEDRCKKLQHENHYLKADLSDNVSAHEKEKQQIHKTSQEAEQKCISLREEVKYLKSDLMEQELGEEREMMAAEENIKRMKMENESITEELSQYQSQIKMSVQDTERKCRQLKEENERVQATLSESHKMELKKVLNDAEERYGGLQKEKKSLKASLDETKAEFKTVMKSMEHKCTKLQDDNKSLKSGMSNRQLELENAVNDIETKCFELQETNESLSTYKSEAETEKAKLSKSLKDMEQKCRQMRDINCKLNDDLALKNTTIDTLVKELKFKLSETEARCTKLQSENDSLLRSMRNHQQSISNNDVSSVEDDVLRDRFEESENLCEGLKEENEKLKFEVQELKEEMDEMYDQFRENEADEYRDIQKELELTAKSCRILQFKLRKSERRNEQVEADRFQFEDKIRLLQNQFTSDDAREHIRSLEEELKMAKEVSVRLHDELDFVEEKRSKAEDENRKLQQEIDDTDKKSFRLVMEIDRLKDKIDALKSQQSMESVGRKTTLKKIGKQGSCEYDTIQLTRDLYDSLERENDIKEQLRFSEEEANQMRKKVSDVEEENESLTMQLRKMTFKNKGAKRKQGLGIQTHDSLDIPQTEATLNLQIELMDEELKVSHKKVVELQQDNENLTAEVKFHQVKLEEATKRLSVIPAPSSPKMYYEDKMNKMTEEIDALKWKIIEKDRAIDGMSAHVSHMQMKQSKLQKSRSLDAESHYVDAARQLEMVQHEKEIIRERLTVKEEELSRVKSENTKLLMQASRRIPFIKADDAAVENIELRDRLKKLDSENRSLTDKVKRLTDSLHSLSKDSRPTLSQVPGIPAEPVEISKSRDPQLHLVSDEATILRVEMAESETQSADVGVSANRVNQMDFKTKSNDDTFGESRVELMERVLDLEEEVGDLLKIISAKDHTSMKIEKELKSIKSQLDNVHGESRKKELELLMELDMVHDKNSVLSNLLDIVKDRAEETENELERLLHESSSPRERSGSRASQASALSGISCGSDEVFQLPPGPIVKDWEKQFIKRIDCLEQLLAEERHKVQTAEKKLSVQGIDSLSTAMSDDTKLRLREKEIMQQELLESQKHLRIAADLIKGLRDRLHTFEEEHYKLRHDYAAMATELDFRDYQDEEEASNKKTSPLKGDEKTMSDDLHRLRAECAHYKLKAEELEYKVSEINEVWVSKSAASEKEKTTLETRLRDNETDLENMQASISPLEDEIKEKELLLGEKLKVISDKDESIFRRDEIIKEQEDITKQRDHDFHSLFEQVSQKDDTIRQLRETIRVRDERLREKDEILQTLNINIDVKQKEMSDMDDTVLETISKLNVKEEEVQKLKSKILHAESSQIACATDYEKENLRLKSKIKEFKDTLDRLKDENEDHCSCLQIVKDDFKFKEIVWIKEKCDLQAMVNQLNEKYKLLEMTSGVDNNDKIQLLKETALKQIDEKEKTAASLIQIRREHEHVENAHQLETDILKSSLKEKAKLIEKNSAMMDRLNQEVDRLQIQADMAHRLQQGERVLRAEQLTMKVRYESKLGKLQKDYTKMLSTAERLQKERDLHRDIIKGIQKGMSQLKANYTADVAHWQDDKAVLERQIHEIEQGRIMANDLRRKGEELRTKVVDQERMRAELLNNFATEKSAWNIERSNMQSKLNQMEDQLSTKTKAQCKAKDIQTRMETAWEIEHRDQKQLLTEAHNLALDLQQQLKSRDKAYAIERKEMIAKFESEHIIWEAERRTFERKLVELDSCTKRMLALQKTLREAQDKLERNSTNWDREKTDLLRRMAQSKQLHHRDNRKLDDVLRGFTRLKELGALIAKVPPDKPPSSLMVPQSNDNHVTSTSDEEKQKEISELNSNLNQTIIKYVREAITQIKDATDDLDEYQEENTAERASHNQIRRSLSSSQLELYSADTYDLDGDDVFVRASAADPKTGMPYENARPHEANTSRMLRSRTYDMVSDCTKTGGPNSHARPHLNGLYTSGTRSAHGSRSVSPDIHCMRTSSSPVRRLVPLPEPPPSFLLPRIDGRLQSPVRSVNSEQLTSPTPNERDNITPVVTPSNSVQRLSRPKTLTKSLSIDATLITSHTCVKHLHPDQGSSASCSPVANIPSLLFTPAVIAEASATLRQDLLLNPETDHDTLIFKKGGSLDRLSPRSARKKFFEEDDASSKNDASFNLLEKPDTQHVRQSSLPNQQDLPTASWTDRVNMVESVEQPPSSFQTANNIPNPVVPPKAYQGHGHAGAKEKRKFFKKAASLDSSVMSGLAGVGVQMIPPAVPSGFTPHDLFAAVKRKLRPGVKKSLAQVDSHDRLTPIRDQSFEQEAVTDSKNQQPTPSNSSNNAPFHKSNADLTTSNNKREAPSIKEKSHEPVKGKAKTKYEPKEKPSTLLPNPEQVNIKRGRSRSAERPLDKISPILLHADVITPMQVWKFSETHV